MPLGIEIALVVLVAAAAWSDLRTRRIPNWITVPGAAIGVGLQFFYGGFHGTLDALAGAGLGFGLFILVYAAGGMGAGDVKLFAAVGALVGPQALVVVFVFTALLGGMAGVALAMYRRRLRETFEHAGELMFDLGRLHWQEVRAAGATTHSLRLPYGAVIAAGTLLFLLV